MVVRGKVKNGKVVLTNPKALPDGTDVEVRPVKKRGKASGKRAASRPTAGRRGTSARANGKPAKSRTKKPKRGWLLELMRPYIGMANDLPSDMSVNLDHYLYGVPKQK